MNTKTLTPRMKLDTQAKKYILEAIDNEGYHDLNGDTVVLRTDKEKLTFLYTTFKAEYGWMIERVGEQRAFAEWLQGLPSCFNIAFTNHDILVLAMEWGYYDGKMTESQENKVIMNWWNLIAVKTFQLFRKHGIK